MRAAMFRKSSARAIGRCNFTPVDPTCAHGAPRTTGLAVLAGLLLVAACGRLPGERDCNDGAGCLKQAQPLLQKALADKSPALAEKAVGLLQKGCDLGSAEACATLGLAFEVGDDLTPRDLPRSVRLYEKGCLLQDASACSQLSHLYRKGEGLPKDLALASKYRRLACGFANRMTRDTFCEWSEGDELPKEAAPAGQDTSLVGPHFEPTLQNLGKITKPSASRVHQ